VSGFKKRKKGITGFLIVISFLFPVVATAGECKPYVVLFGIDDVIKETGWSEGRAAGHRINLWDSPARKSIVGKLIPGTHALLIGKTPDNYHYKIQSPKKQGGNIGWVGAPQVKEVIKQNTTTYEHCK